MIWRQTSHRNTCWFTLKSFIPQNFQTFPLVPVPVSVPFRPRTFNSACLHARGQTGGTCTDADGCSSPRGLIRSVPGQTRDGKDINESHSIFINSNSNWWTVWSTKADLRSVHQRCDQWYSLTWQISKVGASGLMIPTYHAPEGYGFNSTRSPVLGLVALSVPPPPSLPSSPSLPCPPSL